MRISGEGKIGIALALVFGFGGGALVRFQDQPWIGAAMMAFSAIGAVALLFHHIGIERGRMGPAIMMSVGAMMLLGGAAWYWLGQQPKLEVMEEPDLDHTISFNCAMSLPPERFSDDATLHVVQIIDPYKDNSQSSTANTFFLQGD